MKRFCVILLLLLGVKLFAAEVMPPAPANYFNDYANVVDSATATQLNHTLADFERQTSEQIVVAVFPKMESDSSVEDYAVRVFRSWGVGQKDKNNGAVLFVFVQNHKMFLATGYGLEGVLPDALCKRIIDEQITPRFKAGDFTGGLAAGVQSILAATKGEYKGTGQTVAQRQTYYSNYSSNNESPGWSVVFVIIFVGIIVVIPLTVLSAIVGSRQGTLYGTGGRRRYYNDWNNTAFTGGFFNNSNSSGGFSSGSGGFSGGSNDSFSSGGGSSGGGGAGGSW